MSDALPWHRIQFAFTISFHYLFPQLTMGLALLIVWFKMAGLKTGDEANHECARFWGRIFGINFAVGVVTGIPLEFQFGTNWARFSNFAGEIIGQTLAMEGVFAFFMESSFLGLFLFGEKRLGPRGHLAATIALFLGSWLSGYFIIATNAFMQHPVGYQMGPNGTLQLADFWSFLVNPWALWQYAPQHDGVGGDRLVRGGGGRGLLVADGLPGERHAGICLRVAVTAGFFSCILVAFPTGDGQGRLVAEHQPATLAAMEGLFEGARTRTWPSSGSPTSVKGNWKTRLLFQAFSASWPTGLLAARSRGCTISPRSNGPTTWRCSTTAITSWRGSGRCSFFS